MSSSLIIRADASLHIGTGHVMRCMALAQAAQAHGLDVHLVGRFNVDWVYARLQQDKIPFIHLDDQTPEQEVPDVLLAQLAGAGYARPDVVALDGYHFGPDCHKAVKSLGCKLLVIDDYAHLPEYRCDVLLNQNIGAEELLYQGVIGEKCFGPEYALIRSEFINACKDTGHKKTRSLQKILISLGGGDQIEDLEAVYLSIREFLRPEMKLSVVLGGMSGPDVLNRLSSCPCPLDILKHSKDMPGLFLSMDFVITAGGSTCWELCYLGVPFAVVSIAENQKHVAQYLIENNIACEIGALGGLFSGDAQSALERYSLAGKALVDGKGAQRIINKLFEQTFYLRAAELSDSQFLLDTVNHDEIRKFGASLIKVQADEHARWFAEQLASDDSYIYIVVKSGSQEAIGYIRFKVQQGAATLSVALLPGDQGHGLGVQVIKQGCYLLAKEAAVKSIHAYVRADNPRALHSFEKAGFMQSKKAFGNADCPLVEFLVLV